MNKIVTAILLTLAASGVCAEPVRFINGDGSEITELCIAAATSSSELNVLATRLGVTTFTKGDVICNGMPLNKFARQYRTVDVPETVIMSFRKNDETPETELCYAAVTYSADFERIKAAYLRKNENFDKVRCNNLSLDNFVEKYSYQALTASIH
jgi:hypothetical protein